MKSTIALLSCGISLSAALLSSSKILAGEGAAVGREKPRDESPGRPLYSVNTVEMPEGNDAKSCITLRFDISTHSVTVDPRPHDRNSLAWACFTDKIEKTGWSSLTVDTTDDQDLPLAVRAWGAGFLEGMLTYGRMKQFHSNVEKLIAKDLYEDGSKKAVGTALRMALLAWETLAGGDASMEPDDDIGRQAWAALLQMRGMRDGYNFVASQNDAGEPHLTAMDVLKMNMHNEIPAIIQIFAGSEQAKAMSSGDPPKNVGLVQVQPPRLQAKSFLGNYTKGKSQTDPAAMAVSSSAFDLELEKLTEPKFFNLTRWSRTGPSGSALVKRVGPEGQPEDIISGHVTEGDYGEMLRIMKTYHLKFKTLNGAVSLSSYPGCISSTDDYFVTSNGFVIMSTNMGVPQRAEYAQPPSHDDGLPAFVRAMIATRLATQLRTWARLYAFTNGIAGSKQWLLTDYSKLKIGQPLGNDTVWLVESLPTIQRAGDVSQALMEKGFFQAHGEPHFAQIREIYGLDPNPSEYAQMKASALMDKAATASTLASARALLTEVDASRGASQKPVASRHDLSAEHPVPAGGLDAKVTSRCMVGLLATQAKSGPAREAALGGFSWRKNGAEQFPGWPWQGVPESPDFEWTMLEPGKIRYPISTEDEQCEMA